MSHNIKRPEPKSLLNTMFTCDKKIKGLFDIIQYLNITQRLVGQLTNGIQKHKGYFYSFVYLKKNAV